MWATNEHAGRCAAPGSRSSRRSRRYSGLLVAVALTMVAAACARNAAPAGPNETTVPAGRPGPSAAPASTAVPTPTTLLVIPVYVVKQGDTMGKIAKNLGVSLETLMAANGITNANKISVGQKLRIPASATTVAAPAAPAATPTSAG